MIYRPSCVVASLLVLLSAAPASASDYGEGNARVRLVTSVARAEAGGTFLLGVHFEIRPGWHIYWRNPGGAGLATDIQWQLPRGFRVGPLQWPLPIAFVQSGDIPGYGYEGSVVLATEVGVPANGQIRDGLGARISWLACKGVCVLGSAELGASLNDLPVDPVFRRWSKDLPMAAGSGDAPFMVSTTGGVGDEGLALWLRWRNPPREVGWFPDPPEALEVEDVRVKTRGGLTRVDAVVRPMAGAVEKPRILQSLVVVTGDDGLRRGWELAVELKDNE